MNPIHASIGLVATCTAVGVCSPTSASFVGLDYEVVGAAVVSTGECVLTMRVYAWFDDPNDRLLSVALADVSTNAPGGWYQHPFGIDTPFNPILLELDEDVQYDSFVTIGTDTHQPPIHSDGDWDSEAFAEDSIKGGWFIPDPLNPFSLPNRDGRVLLMQLSMNEWIPTSQFNGAMTIFYRIPSGEVFSETTGVSPFIGGAVIPLECEGDLNDDGVVGPADLAQMLGA